MSEIYSDNMVLQCGCPLDIHGVADAGEKVTVSIAGQTESTKAGANGKWADMLETATTGRPSCSDRLYRKAPIAF